MRVLTSVFTVLALPLLVAAHGDHSYLARQASSSPSPSSSLPSSTITSTPVSVTSLNGSLTGSLTAAPTSAPPNITISLLSTNPSAVPLASIIANQSSSPTQPLPSTPPAGATPTFLPGAPPLPDVSTINPSNYPKMDVVPPTDSPEVQQWIQEVKDTGIVIPGFAPTNPGGCSNNSVAAADNTRCWWTCGGCTAPFDIVDCPDKLNWGLTYDDGPSFYTSELLAFLDQYSLKSTFFVVGSRAVQFPHTTQLEYMDQHQIAVHTWSHPPLTTLTNDQIIAELGWSKKIIKDVTGVTPNMMRPPYGDIDDRVRAICVAMGLTPSIWSRFNATTTFDTGDYYIAGNLTTSTQVILNWENIMDIVPAFNSGFIVLEHDLFEQSVEIATGYILPDALAHKPPFTIQPIIECLHLPLSDAYIETNNNQSNPPVLSGTDVTIVPPTATGSAGSNSGGSHSSADGHLSVGFGLMFITTVLTLLGGVLVARF